MSGFWCTSSTTVMHGIFATTEKNQYNYNYYSEIILGGKAVSCILTHIRYNKVIALYQSIYSHFREYQHGNTHTHTRPPTNPPWSSVLRISYSRLSIRESLKKGRKQTGAFSLRAAIIFCLCSSKEISLERTERRGTPTSDWPADQRWKSSCNKSKNSNVNLMCTTG